MKANHLWKNSTFKKVFRVAWVYIQWPKHQSDLDAQIN